MKHIVAMILLPCALAGCSLVTVPVKAASAIVTTTVKTTGDVVTAPFDAVGRSRRPDEPDESSKPGANEEARRAQPSHLEENGPGGQARR